MSEELPKKLSESPELWKKVIPNAMPTKYPFAFYIGDDTAYISIHFDGQFFERIDTHVDTDIEEYLDEMKSDLGVNKIMLSCCYPDKAKKLLEERSDISFVGHGDHPTRTLYNSGRKELTVEAAP